MGFLFRVRMASFFAGAASASVVGFYLLYKDYMLAQDVVRQEKKEMRSDSDEFEALKQDIKAIKQHLDMENGKKDRPTETGESD